MTDNERPNRTRSMSVGAALGTGAAVLLGAMVFSSLDSASAERTTGDRPVFVSIIPCRVTDTRPTQGIGGRTTPIGTAETFDVDVRPTSGDCVDQIPLDALSVQLNVTVLNATEQTFLTLHSTGSERPDASALNPAPDQPPTPNAVATAISPSGEFSVYNDAGSVDVLIDINGFYVAHNHDDRYQTEEAADARYEQIPDQVIVSGLEFYDRDPGGSDWRFFDGHWIHNAPGFDCLFAPVDIPDGATVLEVTTRHLGSDGAEISAGLRGRLTEPGRYEGPARTDPIAESVVTIAGSPNDEITELTFDVLPNSATSSAYTYTAFVCTSDDFRLTSMAITLG